MQVGELVFKHHSIDLCLDQIHAHFFIKCCTAFSGGGWYTYPKKFYISERFAWVLFLANLL